MGCKMYSAELRVFLYARVFLQEDLTVTVLYLNCQAIFSLLGFICVFLHLLETPYLSPLKSTLTTEQT